jgi:hypothetical protein
MSSTPAEFLVMCKGRGLQGKEVFKNPVVAKVTVEEVKFNVISLSVSCKYISVSGFGCNASKSDKGGCAYVATLPNEGPR